VTGPIAPGEAARTTDADEWWPSRDGADDEAGALNEITPAGVAEAGRHMAGGPAAGVGPRAELRVRLLETYGM